MLEQTIVENMFRILPILGKILVRGVKSKTSYSTHDIHVMGALNYHGTLTMTGIGVHLSLPKPQVTSLVNRLAADGLVERLYDENDRRIILIQLTETGREKYKEIKSLISESLITSLKELDENTLKELGESSSSVAAILIQINKNQLEKCGNNGTCSATE